MRRQLTYKAAQRGKTVSRSRTALERYVARWRTPWQDAWRAVTTTVRAEIRQTRPVRPRKTPRLEDRREDWVVEVTIGAVDATRRQRELERRSTFVLITTVPTTRLSDTERLREYKEQTSVERHFHFVKDPALRGCLIPEKSRNGLRRWSTCCYWPVCSIL